MRIMVRDTGQLISQAFLKPETPLRPRFSIEHDARYIENKSSLGTALMHEDEMLIRLGTIEMEEYYHGLAVYEDKKETIASFVGLSIFAGALLTDNIINSQGSSVEVRSEYNSEMRDVKSIHLALQVRESVGLDDESHQIAVASAIQTLDRVNDNIVETANIQRIGAGIVAEVARQNQHDGVFDAVGHLEDCLSRSVALAQDNARILGNATGNYTNNLASLYQGFIGMRGFGYAIPASRDEILALRGKLIDAQKEEDKISELSVMLGSTCTAADDVEEIFRNNGGW